jgi:class 3 adenylate cyclase/tetratricopeptide (TPR) repeat protein
VAAARWRRPRAIASRVGQTRRERSDRWRSRPDALLTAERAILCTVPALCSSCAATVPEGAKFCGECGASVLPSCGKCGTVAAQAEQRFCFECGAALASATEPVAASPAPISGPGAEPRSVERRQVTVLFADLTGFTSFSEARDAEDVREMLSEYFDIGRRIIGSYGGQVEKFIGDAVMALWGAPIAHEDDAERAVRAGLDLVAAVTQLGDRLGVRLRLRVGVLTGRAAVEVDAVAEGMVIGDAINTASRIQSVAEPGSVLVDDVTRTVTAGAIAYEDGGAHSVKGKREPVHTWRALRVIAEVGGVGRTDLELPLVGRDREMGVIRGALDALIESYSGLQLVSVIGEPGLGKSRLAWELKKYADGLAAAVLWHHGQALSFGQGLGFAALAEMVRARAEINVDETTSSRRVKLQVLLDNVFASSDADNRALAMRGLSRLLGLDDGQELLGPGELFSSWRLLFERLAVRDPVVMLFEDLHWADQGLFDFISHLCDWAARSRIIVLVFSRPDERLNALALRGQRVDLAPLSESEIETLLASAVEDAPAGLVRSVREHAAGVPLFAVESLRMLADRGVMVAEEQSQRYRVISEVDDLDVPPSIHALVAARLDRLGDFERRILRDGAVLGQRFSGAAAAALAGVDASEAGSALAGLVSKQFLSVDTDPRSQARGMYSFVHRQVQRVALDTLSKRDRKARHLAAVEHLSAQAPDPDLAAILAGHLVAAFEAQPTAGDAGEIRRRALGLTLDAAHRAEGVGALNEAVALFAQAARIEPDEARRAEHLYRAARCAERYGNLEQVAAGHYAAARELHEQAGRSREALRLRARELSAYTWSRPPSQLIDPLREIYEALRDQRDAAFADAAEMLASTLYAAGDAEAAERIAAEAAEAAERFQAYEELGLALNCRASALIELARPVEALPVFQAALEIRERYVPSDVSATLTNIAVTFTALGRFEEALRAGQEAMAAGLRLANRVHRNTAALILARAMFSLGRWDEAVATVEGVAPETAPANQGMVLGPPLLVAIHRGELEQARAMIEEFDRREADGGAAFESDYRSLRAVALANLNGAPLEASAAIDRAQSGDYAEWPTWLPPAIDLIARMPETEPLGQAADALRRETVPKTSPVVSTQLARLDALVAFRSGQIGAAVAHWLTAIDAASQAGMPFDAATLRLELLEHCPEHPDAPEGLEEPLHTFASLRAEPWAARAQRAMRTAA